MAGRVDLAKVEFQAGDVLAWCGRQWQSRVIELWTSSFAQLLRGELISHLSITAPYQEQIKNWESTTLSPLACDIQGRQVSGVQCHDPYQEIAQYDGSVWLLRLPPRNALSQRQASQLGDFLKLALGTAYDYQGALSAGELSWMKRIGWLRPDRSTYFCDELVAYALFDVRVLPRTFNPSKQSPAWLAWWLQETSLYDPLVILK